MRNVITGWVSLGPRGSYKSKGNSQAQLRLLIIFIFSSDVRGDQKFQPNDLALSWLEQSTVQDLMKPYLFQFLCAILCSVNGFGMDSPTIQ